MAPIIPRNQGGSDDISNLQALCFRWKAGKRDPGSYDFRMCDDPLARHDAIRQANQRNQARMVAGYCWNWASKDHLNAWDITIEPYGYRARWNLSKDGSVWIMKPGTVEEVGLTRDPKAIRLKADAIIRNTYRTLMSRGTKACWVFACDPELNQWLRQAVGMGS